MLLDDVAAIRSSLSNEAIDPVQIGVLCESSGAHGLACTYNGSDAGISERDLRILREVRKTFLNVRIPVDPEVLRLALSVAPDMVTFVDAKPSSPRDIRPIDPTIHAEQIGHMLPDLQANDIPVALSIQPEINILKSISRLPIDYVEFDATAFTGASDINEEIIALDKIKSAAVAASKLGLGVNCCGGITFSHIPALLKVPNLEDVVVGGQFIQRALVSGIDRAIREALNLIRHREIE
ncbi:MAG: pyridoxine 5'-phosphate synthase [Calditrichia bacterium]